SQLLKIATSLVRTHGFTREALSRSVLKLELPASNLAHSSPLSDSAVSSLFGKGDYARRTLIEAWLNEGLAQMAPSSDPSPTPTRSLGSVLHTRLTYNEPVLRYLPGVSMSDIKAFALLATPEDGLPALDPRPALKHAAKIADEAACISGDTSSQLSWYTRRASLATIYSAAELHQLTSPETAHAFLDSLLAGTCTLEKSVGEVQLFASYVFKSWKGIIQSRGILTPMSLSEGVGFRPNFSCSHSITLPHPISKVFPILGTVHGHERVCRLSKLCTHFELLDSDTVSIPAGAALAESHVRTLPSSEEMPGTGFDSVTATRTTRTLARQSFTMTETIPLFMGLLKNDVVLRGTLTWDEDARVALYESESSGGVQVWKVRLFEEVDEDSTRVSERIEGLCPRWMRWIVQREADKGHM
ncbi:hypothetical protein F5880DRAFT_1469228, partial [Lentinula raphanica]